MGKNIKIGTKFVVTNEHPAIEYEITDLKFKLLEIVPSFVAIKWRNSHSKGDNVINYSFKNLKSNLEEGNWVLKIN